jgi:hypothetical protein
MWRRALRTLVGLLVGLFVISLAAETIEFIVVTAIHGSVTTDPEIYFGIRNRLPVLAAKFLYNGLAALPGGFVCAWVAGRAEVKHGLALALIQAAILAWAATASGPMQYTPLWVWIGLIVSMSPLIVVGSWLRARRRRPA